MATEWTSPLVPLSLEGLVNMCVPFFSGIRSTTCAVGRVSLNIPQVADGRIIARGAALKKMTMRRVRMASGVHGLWLGPAQTPPLRGCIHSGKALLAAVKDSRSRYRLARRSFECKRAIYQGLGTCLDHPSPTGGNRIAGSCLTLSCLHARLNQVAFALPF